MVEALPRRPGRLRCPAIAIPARRSRNSGAWREVSGWSKADPKADPKDEREMTVTTKARKRSRRGDGTVERIAGGYRAVVSLGRDPATGKRRRVKSPVFPTSKVALAWKRDYLTQHASGIGATAGKMTVAQWLDQWLARRQPDIAPKTYDHD